VTQLELQNMRPLSDSWGGKLAHLDPWTVCMMTILLIIKIGFLVFHDAFKDSTAKFSA
jgi:hypothetical protein